MTNHENLRAGQTVRFIPTGRQRRVTVHITFVEPFGVTGYYAKVNNDGTISTRGYLHENSQDCENLFLVFLPST